MGHQVNYFVTPKDLKELENRICARGDVGIVHFRSRTAEPHVVSSLNDATWNGEQWLRGYLVRLEDLGAIVTSYIPTQECWTIEVLSSPVIQFTGGYFDGYVLRQGRVYYTDGDYGPDNAWVNKSEAFRKWAQSIFRIVKKTLKRQDWYYLGSDAQTWIKSLDAKYDLRNDEFRSGP